MMMTRCQDHTLTENIWGKTSYSGDKWRCNDAGRQTNERMREDRATQPFVAGRLSFATINPAIILFHQSIPWLLWQILFGVWAKFGRTWSASRQGQLALKWSGLRLYGFRAVGETQTMNFYEHIIAEIFVCAEQGIRQQCKFFIVRLWNKLDDMKHNWGK